MTRRLDDLIIPAQTIMPSPGPRQDEYAQSRLGHALAARGFELTRSNGTANYIHDARAMAKGEFVDELLAAISEEHAQLVGRMSDDPAFGLINRMDEPYVKCWRAYQALLQDWYESLGGALADLR